MYSRTDDNSFLLWSWIVIIWSGGDSQIVAPVSSQGSAQCISRDIIQLLFLDFLYVVHQIRIGVWLGVGKEYGIIIVLEVVGECEGVVTSLIVRHLLPPIVVLVVSDVFSGAVPAELLLLKFLLWEGQNFHALVEETLGFHQVEHVKLHFLSLPRVLDTEVEPLSVALRIDVILENEVIFSFGLLMRQLKISAFKSALED